MFIYMILIIIHINYLDFLNIPCVYNEHWTILVYKVSCCLVTPVEQRLYY